MVKHCQRGHSRFNKFGRCQDCINAWRRANHWKYDARQKERQKELYRQKRQEYLARNRAWREQNTERERFLNRVRYYISKENPTDADIAFIRAVKAAYPYRKSATGLEIPIHGRR